jgi:hypothetical protein
MPMKRGAQQLEELLVAGEVERDLGHELKRVAVRRLPGGELAQELLGPGAVADEVVVHDEGICHAQLVQPLDLGHGAGHRLGARLAPVHDDDVAELALEGATPRELHGHGAVAVHAQELVARHRRLAQIRQSLRAIELLPAPGLEVVQEGLPDLLGFADEEDVDLALELLRTQRGAGPSDHHELSARAKPVDQLEHPLAVDDVPGDPHQIGFDVEVHLFDVLVA